MPIEADQVTTPGRRDGGPFWHRLATRVFACLFALVSRLVCGSNRLTTTGEDLFGRYAAQGGNIYAFWHSRLFYLTYYYAVKQQGRRLTVLVSLSRDGDYGVAVARRLGQDVVRGSSSRGGRRAVAELVRRIAAGQNVAITPDGPRGPAFRVNEGTIKLAQITGARIIPVSFDASRKREFRSWDRFILVKPFGRVHMAFGEPIEVPRKMTASERKHFCEQLEQSLHQLDRLCAEQLSIRGADQADRADKGELRSSRTPAPTRQATAFAKDDADENVSVARPDSTSEGRHPLQSR